MLSSPKLNRTARQERFVRGLIVMLLATGLVMFGISFVGQYFPSYNSPALHLVLLAGAILVTTMPAIGAVAFRLNKK